MSAKARKPASRAPETPQPDIDSYRGQHLALAQRQIASRRCLVPAVFASVIHSM